MIFDIKKQARRVASYFGSEKEGRGLTLVRVTDKSELKEFVQFNLDLYKDNPNHVPDLIGDEMKSLSRESNPAFAFSEADLFMVKRGGEVVGRIAAIINHRANKKWKQNRARFGWVDFIDDDEVVDLLFDTVEAWARERGCDEIHGPMGFTDLDKEGMLIEGFDQMGTMITIYNYPYYPKQLARRGYEKDIDWLEYKIYIPKIVPEKHARLCQIVQDRYGVRLLKFKERDGLMRYGRAIFELINEAYAPLYSVSELTDDQIEYYIKQYLPMVNLDFVNLVVTNDGEVVGFGITLPSIVKALKKANGRLFPTGFIHILKALKSKQPEVVELLLIGVKPEYQNKGITALIFEDLIKVMHRYQVKYAESNPELETNLSVMLQWNYFKKVHHKRRRAFYKKLV